MFGFGAPSQLEVVKSEAIKSQLIRELQTSINEVHSLAVITEGPLQQSDIVNQLLFVFEAIFLHESKDYLSVKSFWPFLKNYLLHKDVFDQLRKLNFVNTDAGRCRAWVRIALADHLYESYFRCISEDSSNIERYYRRTALVRDVERMKIVVTLAQGLSEVQFNLAFNSALLNKWPRQPLQLVGLMPPDPPPNNPPSLAPVMAISRPAAPASLDTSSSNRASNSSALSKLIVAADARLRDEDDLQQAQSTATLTRVVAVESAMDASALANSLLVDSLIAQAERQNNVQLDADILNSILDSPHDRPSTPAPVAPARADTEELPESPIAVNVPRRQHVVVADEAIDFADEADSVSNDLATQAMDSSHGNDVKTEPSETEPALVEQEETSATECLVTNADTTDADTVPNGMTEDQQDRPIDSNLLVETNEIDTEDIFPPSVTEVVKPASDVDHDQPVENPVPSDRENETELAKQDSCQHSDSADRECDVEQRESDSVGRNEEDDLEHEHEHEHEHEQSAVPEELEGSGSSDRSAERERMDSYATLLKSYRRHSNSLSMQLDWANDDEIDESGAGAGPAPIAAATPVQKPTSSTSNQHRQRRRRGTSASSSAATFSYLCAGDSSYPPEMSFIRNPIQPFGVSPAQIANEDAISHTDVQVESGYELLTDDRSDEQQQLEQDVENELESQGSPSSGTRNAKRSRSVRSCGKSGLTFAQLTTIQNERGLDEQDFCCRSCKRPLSPGSASTGKRRLDFFDGYSYCHACHVNDTSLIPARILNCWDLKPYPVARSTKRLLERHARRTLVDLGERAERLAEQIVPFRRIEQQRVQLFYLRAYLFTCRADVADRFRELAARREYLFDRVRVYSIADLFDMATGRLDSQLAELVRFGDAHVSSCALCRERGFVCEICKREDVIFPFQVTRTELCGRCRGVYHRECRRSAANRPCPRCRRKDERERLLRAAQLGTDSSSMALAETKTVAEYSYDQREDDEMDFIM